MILSQHGWLILIFPVVFVFVFYLVHNLLYIFVRRNFSFFFFSLMKLEIVISISAGKKVKSRCLLKVVSETKIKNKKFILKKKLGGLASCFTKIIY